MSLCVIRYLGFAPDRDYCTGQLGSLLVIRRSRWGELVNPVERFLEPNLLSMIT